MTSSFRRLASLVAVSQLAFLAQASIIDDAKFVFAFGASYTTEGWDGKSDDVLTRSATSCTTAGPNYMRQFNDALPAGSQLVDFGVSGATTDNAIVTQGVLDFVGQADAFDRLVIAPGALPWTSSNTIFSTHFGINDINASVNKDTTDQPAGTQVHNQILTTFINQVERLYQAGGRAFVFNNVPPFNRAQIAIKQGPDAQAKLAAHIGDYIGVLTQKANDWCASKTDLIHCSVFDLNGLVNDIMNNFEADGFATPDGVCDAYSGRNTCNIDDTTADGCLGPVSSYIWHDDLHLTWKTDSFWADGLRKQIQG